MPESLQQAGIKPGPSLNSPNIHQVQHPFVGQPFVGYSFTKDLPISETLPSSGYNVRSLKTPALRRERRHEKGKVAPRSGSQFKVGPPFCAAFSWNNVFTTNGTSLNPKIEARIDRGFEYDEDEWIGYKRNYFTLAASFQFEGLSLKEFLSETFTVVDSVTNREYAVQFFTLELKSSCVEDGSAVCLVQHTAKRDRGPQNPPPAIPVIPGDSPGHEIIKEAANVRNGDKIAKLNKVFYFERESFGFFRDDDMAALVDYPQGKINRVVRYERVQFSSSVNRKATATNKHFKLTVFLKAVTMEGNIVVIAQTETPPLIIRGRSPSNYKEELPISGSESKIPSKETFTGKAQRKSKRPAKSTSNKITKKIKEEQNENLSKVQNLGKELMEVLANNERKTNNKKRSKGEKKEKSKNSVKKHKVEESKNTNVKVETSTIDIIDKSRSLKKYATSEENDNSNKSDHDNSNKSTLFSFDILGESSYIFSAAKKLKSKGKIEIKEEFIEMSNELKSDEGKLGAEETDLEINELESKDTSAILQNDCSFIRNEVKNEIYKILETKNKMSIREIMNPADYSSKVNEIGEKDYLEGAQECYSTSSPPPRDTASFHSSDFIDYENIESF